jgi:hypothetical protein
MVWVHDTVIPGTLITNRAHLGPDVFTATTRIEAADTHWDEFIHRPAAPIQHLPEVDDRCHEPGWV